jgi:hypothetical protein
VNPKCSHFVNICVRSQSAICVSSDASPDDSTSSINDLHMSQNRPLVVLVLIDTMPIDIKTIKVYVYLMIIVLSGMEMVEKLYYCIDLCDTNVVLIRRTQLRHILSQDHLLCINASSHAYFSPSTCTISNYKCYMHTCRLKIFQL